MNLPYLLKNIIKIWNLSLIMVCENYEGISKQQYGVKINGH